MSTLDAAALESKLAQACLTLLAIPSVTGDEKVLADHLQAWAKSELGPQDIPVVRQNNALIVGSPCPTRPTVCLIGHLDTVPPAGGVFPSPRQDGDKIEGLGSSDMKAAAAVMQILLTQLGPWSALPVAPMIVWYDKEEGPYADNGLGPLLAAHPMLGQIDLAVVMEPTDNTLQLGCMGGIQAKITFSGRAAHSARPWEGDNAIHKAAPFLQAVHGYQAKTVTLEGLPFHEAVSITLAQGGRARNVIPDQFVCNLNYRFVPSPTGYQDALDAIHLWAKDAHVDVLDVAPAGTVPKDNPVLAQLQRLGDLTVQPKQAWTDVARLAAAGIDAVNFGPGFGAQAHQAGEWVSLAQMCKSYAILKQLFTTPLPMFRPSAPAKG